MFDSVSPFLYTASTETTFLKTMKPLESFLTLRIDRKVAETFRAKAKEYGGVSSTMRELVLAFNDDRITVRPDPNRKTIFTHK